MQFTSSN